MFQFTLPRGERHPAISLTLAIEGFQFTLPRGERRVASITPATTLSFNSRSRGGSDP